MALGVELMRITAWRESARLAATIPVAPALEYINRHYMEDFPIETLARLCGMSQSHFRRVFRELLSVGPLEHLNRTRILKACSLMRMSEDSILSISGQVGFQSLSSFNRHFLVEMGTTPSQWCSAAGNNFQDFHSQIPRLDDAAQGLSPGGTMMQEYWITEYGAVADGVTNCAAAIQAAVDAAAQAGGGRVMVPAGRFPQRQGDVAPMWSRTYRRGAAVQPAARGHPPVPPCRRRRRDGRLERGFFWACGGRTSRSRASGRH